MTIIGLCNVNSLKHGTLSMPSSVVQVTFSRHQEWLLVSNVNLLVCTYLCRTFIIHCVCVCKKVDDNVSCQANLQTHGDANYSGDESFHAWRNHQASDHLLAVRFSVTCASSCVVGDASVHYTCPLEIFRFTLKFVASGLTSQRTDCQSCRTGWPHLSPCCSVELTLDVSHWTHPWRVVEVGG